ncbi:15365_t:CDS:1, partial [Acaulospora morrowiae]
MAYLTQIDKLAIITEEEVGKKISDDANRKTDDEKNEFKKALEKLLVKECDNIIMREELPTRSKEKIAIKGEVDIMIINEKLIENQVQQEKDMLMKDVIHLYKAYKNWDVQK